MLDSKDSYMKNVQFSVAICNSILFSGPGKVTKPAEGLGTEITSVNEVQTRHIQIHSDNCKCYCIYIYISEQTRCFHEKF